MVSSVQSKIVGEGYLDNKLNEYVFRTLKWSPEADKLVEIPKNDTDEGNDEHEAHKVISLYLSQLSYAGYLPLLVLLLV